MRTRIKICGLRTAAAARVAIEGGADAIGIVRAPGSPRCATDDEVRAVAAAVPPSVTLVGVFRNQSPDEWAAFLDLARPVTGAGITLQLHGDEDEAMVARAPTPVIRGFAFTPERARQWDSAPHVAALLLDSERAGSGAAFPYAPLVALRGELQRRIFLAGGLNPENVAEAIAAVRPFAVDVSSGVESAPGEKCPQRIAAFCAAVHNAG